MTNSQLSQPEMADVLCTVKLRAPEALGVCHVAVGHKVYSFGGEKNDLYVNVHVFNTVSLKWTKVFPRDDACYKDNPDIPTNRSAYTGAAVDNVIYIFGGRGLDFCHNELHAFDTDTHTWLHTEASGSVPSGRYFHSASVSGKAMYVYGGLTDLDKQTNNTYKLDTTTMVWSLTKTRGTAPPASYGHTVAVIGTKMFFFGSGSGDVRDKNTMRVFDTETSHWLSMPFPLPHSVAFAYDGELYTFGERDCSRIPTRMSPLLKSRPEALSWKKVEPKGDFPMFGGTCCVVGDRVVVFGDDVFFGGGNITYILDFSPSLKTLCQLAVLRHGLEPSELPRVLREELAAMTLTDETDPPPRSRAVAKRFLNTSWPVWRHLNL